MKRGPVTAKQLLRECEVFAHLSEPELDKIATAVSIKEYDAGVSLILEGEKADELLIIDEGKIALQMSVPKSESQASRRLTIDIAGPGELIGWSALVEPHVYSFTGLCLQKVRALSIRGTELRWLMQDNPKMGYEILQGVIKLVASRLDETRRVLMSERLLTLQSQ